MDRSEYKDYKKQLTVVLEHANLEIAATKQGV